MTIPEYGITPQGFKVKRLIDIKTELEDLFIGEFGDINLDAQSVTGQIIGIFSKVLADIWENQADVYASQYPNSASGISLDNVVSLNGITRLPARRTTVIGVATGIPGTLIPAGSLARIPGSQQLFFSTASVVIDNSNAVQNIVEVQSAAIGQEYRIIISGITYTYSLPTISFSIPLSAGNVISSRINGFNMPDVPFSIDSDTTLNNLGASIVANAAPAVASFLRVGNTLELTPANGYSIIVNNVTVNGGPSVTATTTFRAPLGGAAEVAEEMALIMNLGSNINATWLSGNRFTITAQSTTSPYAISVGPGFSIVQTSSPVPFSAQSYGPIPVPAGTLTEIVTPVAGWQSLTNFEAGLTGRNIETDAELRARRALSIRVTGAATVEAIRSRILQEVPGVTSVLVFENVTMTQEPSTVTFSQDFIATNQVEVFVDNVSMGIVNYITSNAVTMALIADALEDSPYILSATVAGIANHDIIIDFEDGQEVEIAFVLSGTTPPTYVISGGRPPKSFEVVVEGGSDQAVADKIWQVKPAGIRSFGNTGPIMVIDSQGNSQPIFFTRGVAVYMFAQAVITLDNSGTFPSNGEELVAQAIVAYGNSLGIGADVIRQRVEAAIFAIPGISTLNLQLARTSNPSNTPIFTSSNIAISDTEVSVWDISRVYVSVI